MTNPPTVTIHRTSAIWLTVAALLFWIASVWSAHECGRTDEAEQVAELAQMRMHAAQVRAWRAK